MILSSSSQAQVKTGQTFKAEVMLLLKSDNESDNDIAV